MIGPRSDHGPSHKPCAAALTAVQKGVVGEKSEVIRALNHLRMLIRFARDLGDFSDSVHRHLEAQIVVARRSAGVG